MIGWLDARETINIGLLFGDLCLLYVLARMLIPEMRVSGWFKDRANQAACALFVYFFGMMIIRTWSAVLLYFLRRGKDIFAIENAYPISMGGSILAFIGTLLIIQTWSIKDERNRSWIIVLLLTAAVMSLTFIAGEN